MRRRPGAMAARERWLEPSWSWIVAGSVADYRQPHGDSLQSMWLPGRIGFNSLPQVSALATFSALESPTFPWRAPQPPNPSLSIRSYPRPSLGHLTNTSWWSACASSWVPPEDIEVDECRPASKDSGVAGGGRLVANSRQKQP